MAEKEAALPGSVPGVEIFCVGNPEVVVFAVAGRVAPDRISQAEETLRALIRQGCRRLVIDISQADEISSSGIGIVVYYHALLSDRDGKLVVVRARPAVMKRIEKFVNRVLTLVDTRQEALELLGRA